MLAQLLPVNGGQPVTLRQTVTVVGRSPRLCDLPLDNTSVSKLHCILVKTDGLVYMRDLGSTNGTRVNGQRVLRGALLPGDQISFSGSAFRVHLAPDPDNAVEESNGELSEHKTAIVGEEANEDNAFGTGSDVRLISDEDLIPED
jgi:pSer/pThr/pTyr-binding forkhead associated (FHA) protein